MKFTHCLAGSSSYRFGIVIQHHTAQQLLHLLVIQRVLDGDFIHLGHMVLGRTHAMDEFAVVRQQQQPGGVLV